MVVSGARAPVSSVTTARDTGVFQNGVRFIETNEAVTDNPEIRGPVSDRPLGDGRLSVIGVRALHDLAASHDAAHSPACV